MTETSNVVIVGAGQAGLSLSHELAHAGVDHVVLERGRVGQKTCVERPGGCRTASRPASASEGIPPLLVKRTRRPRSHGHVIY